MVESRLSALVDGELEHEEAMAVLAAVNEQPGLRQEWQLLHSIGDALRQMPSLSPDFNARFAERLAKEPTILAPHTILHELPLHSPAGRIGQEFGRGHSDPPWVVKPTHVESYVESRSPSGRRFPQPRRSLIALSAAASVAAVSLVAWVAPQFNNEGGLNVAANAVVAKTGTTVAAPAINVGSYLAAHQEYSRAVQGIDPYQRVSFEKTQGGGQ